MKKLARVVSALALAGTVAPPVLYLLGGLDLPAVHGLMLAATLAWFASVPLWMGAGD